MFVPSCYSQSTYKFRAPTVSLEEAKYVPTKHNFSEVFDFLNSLVKRFSLKQTGEAITRPCQLGLGLHWERKLPKAKPIEQWWRSVGWQLLVNHGNLLTSSFLSATPKTTTPRLKRKIISALKMSPCGAIKKLGLSPTPSVECKFK